MIPSGKALDHWTHKKYLSVLWTLRCSLRLLHLIYGQKVCGMLGSGCMWQFLFSYVHLFVSLTNSFLEQFDWRILNFNLVFELKYVVGSVSCASIWRATHFYKAWGVLNLKWCGRVAKLGLLFGFKYYDGPIFFGPSLRSLNELTVGVSRNFRKPTESDGRWIIFRGHSFHAPVLNVKGRQSSRNLQQLSITSLAELYFEWSPCPAVRGLNPATVVNPHNKIWLTSNALMPVIYDYKAASAERSYISPCLVGSAHPLRFVLKLAVSESFLLECSFEAFSISLSIMYCGRMHTTYFRKGWRGAKSVLI